MSSPKPIGRPKLAPEKRRTARLSMRTYPAVAVKAAMLGTAAVEDLILNGDADLVIIRRSLAVFAADLRACVPTFIDLGMTATAAEISRAAVALETL